MQCKCNANTMRMQCKCNCKCNVNAIWNIMQLHMQCTYNAITMQMLPECYTCIYSLNVLFGCITNLTISASNDTITLLHIDTITNSWVMHVLLVMTILISIPTNTNIFQQIIMVLRKISLFVTIISIRPLATITTFHSYCILLSLAGVICSTSIVL